jgi:methionyl-tRNA formyltransferase
MHRGDTLIKVWRAHAQPGGEGATPGTVLVASAGGLQVACGRGTLVITEMQRPGSRRMSVAEFLAGMPIRAGEDLRRRRAEPAAPA